MTRTRRDLLEQGVRTRRKPSGSVSRLPNGGADSYSSLGDPGRPSGTDPPLPCFSWAAQAFYTSSLTHPTYWCPHFPSPPSSLILRLILHGGLILFPFFRRILTPHFTIPAPVYPLRRATSAVRLHKTNPKPLPALYALRGRVRVKMLYKAKYSEDPRSANASSAGPQTIQPALEVWPPSSDASVCQQFWGNFPADYWVQQADVGDCYRHGDSSDYLAALPENHM